MVGVLEKKSILQVQMIEAANTGQLLLPGEWGDEEIERVSGSKFC